MKKYFAYIFLFLLAGIGCAEAQTFAGGMSNTVAVQPQDENKTVKHNGVLSDVKVGTDDKEPMFKDAVAKFSQDEDDAKKYDNSEGSVIRFKFVDGDVVFEEDTDRMILLYYGNYKVSRGMDNVVRCSMRVYVLNDLETKVSSIGFKLIWPEISTSLQMQQIQPGVRAYTDIMLLGNGCFTMDKTPTIEVNRCRVKGLSETQCADRVKWFKQR